MSLYVIFIVFVDGQPMALLLKSVTNGSHLKVLNHYSKVQVKIDYMVF